MVDSAYRAPERLLRKYIGDELNFFLKYLSLKKNLCIVGYGKKGHALYEFLLQHGIFVNCICDNQWEKLSIGNLKVISIDECVRLYPDAIFIIPNINFRYALQLQLLRLGIEEENIYLLCNASTITRYAAQLPKDYYCQVVAEMHYERTKIYPNLDAPKSFNEKMMASMVKEPKELKVRLTDKLLVRDWISRKIGEEYLIPLLGTWKQSKDIAFSELPPKYVLKTNHGCNWNIIVNRRNTINEPIIQLMIDDWLKANFAFYYYEMQYRDIVPHIICEEYIENIENDVYDYKVFCFHGEPRYIMFLCQRRKGLKMAFFDLNWNKQPFVYSYPRYDENVVRPAKLEELIEITKILCKGFDQVRVDWYILNDGTIKFGEMTFTSGSGHAAWQPTEWDVFLGEEW